MIIGTTYSHRHARHFQLDTQQAFEELLSLGFDSIRIACYWEEIEANRGEYDFSEIKKLLDLAEKHSQKVVLILGMKGPRFPEFFFPHWLTEKTPEGAAEFIYPFIEATVNALKHYQCITHWQVENEPLFRSGRIHRAIPLTILKNEITLVRKCDSRPVVITLWGNDFQTKKLTAITEQIADVVGLDLYYKVPLFGPFYLLPWHTGKVFSRVIADANKTYWITELQAEPWEKQHFFTRNGKTPSFSPALLRENIQRALGLNPEAVFLWGSEYWLMRKKKGDSSLVNEVKHSIASMKSL